MLSEEHINYINSLSERDKIRFFLYFEQYVKSMKEQSPKKLSQLKYIVKNMDKINEVHKRYLKNRKSS